MTTKQSKSIYQIKISLIGAKPPIWRTVLVPSDLDLDAFHDVIQVAMGWTDSHLHQFIANNVSYGIPDDDFELEMEDEAKMQTLSIVKQRKKIRSLMNTILGIVGSTRYSLKKYFPSIAKLPCLFA